MLLFRPSKDYMEAHQWFEAAEKKGSAEALNGLGYISHFATLSGPCYSYLHMCRFMHLHGLIPNQVLPGVSLPADIDQAFKYFEQVTIYFPPS